MSDGSRGNFTGKRLNLAGGDVTYLWALVALEVLAVILLRRSFRGSHGG
jgi:hypothetical protein